MSADNWTICHGCVQDQHERIVQARKNEQVFMEKEYGKLTVLEYEEGRAERAMVISNLIRELTALQNDEKNTFRENYVIYADRGDVLIRYSGWCKCGYGLEFNQVVPIPAKRSVA